ncbi:uncharacterized protein LOC113206905 [Frankliniella occidentalis]|uniref:Uncharacterized protein LOC113206905 n=1 Tax=Frankliniella occidentalis TaxID=133901 RepID=A0A9C6WT40_FRAOC|nr:uncharacterized protein LOC113206905 [Frankliniella occidentalis]
MQSAMLAAVLMLPIALAAIYPCPSPSPSSEDSSGCGSDDRTYANDNQLQWAVLPGLSAAHPGPCAPPEVTAGRSRRYTPSVDDSLSIIDGLKKVEYLEWQECYNERQCAQPHSGNCTECGAGADDWKCRKMCELKCGCGCMGLPTTAALDGETYKEWEKCYLDLERGCTLSKMEKCEKDCAGDRSCRDSLTLECSETTWE